MMKKHSIFFFLVLIGMFLLVKSFVNILPKAPAVTTAKMDISNISKAVEIYFLDHDKYPLNINGIVDAANLIDPWGTRYRYQIPSKRNGYEYDIISLGEDQIIDTSDDIYYEKDRNK